MKKLINAKQIILSSRNGEFTLEELSNRVKPTDILTVEVDEWETFIYRYIPMEETDEQYERRLLQEQYSED